MRVRDVLYSACERCAGQCATAGNPDGAVHTGATERPLWVAAPGEDAGPESPRTAARCAFCLIFSVTYRDAVCRGSPMPPPARCGVTGLEVAVGRGARRCCERAAIPPGLGAADLAAGRRLAQEAGARRGPLSGDPAGL